MINRKFGNHSILSFNRLKQGERNMKKTMLIGLVMMLAIFLDLSPLYACDGGGGGSSMMGQGGMKGGMMRQGGSIGSPQSGQQYGGQRQGQPLTQDQVQLLLENYLRSTKNPNLKLGKVSESKDYFEAEITTKDGSLVDKIQVDKYTGKLRSAYSFKMISPGSSGQLIRK